MLKVLGSNISILIKILIVFFAPIKGIILLVALATIIDTGFGVWKAKKLKEKDLKPVPKRHVNRIGNDNSRQKRSNCPMDGAVLL